MRWLRRVWDGPFKTPPLQQPVSVGWVLLKIIETIWRGALALCLLVALGLLAVWWSERNPLASQVRVALSASAECQKDGYPIRAAFTNESSKILGEIGVRLRVYERGKSEDVTSYLSSTHDLHSIVRPGEEMAYCFGMPPLGPGTTGPYTVAADVAYAYEVSKDVPLSAIPPPLVRTNRVDGAALPAPPKGLWQKAVNLIGLLICLGLFVSGAVGLLAVWDRAFKTRLREKALDGESHEGGCVAVLLLGFFNAGIVTACSYGISSAGFGQWITDLDSWSRANGYADGGLMLVTSIACQWPWLLLRAFPNPISGEADQ